MSWFGFPVSKDYYDTESDPGSDDEDYSSNGSRESRSSDEESEYESDENRDVQGGVHLSLSGDNGNDADGNSSSNSNRNICNERENPQGDAAEVEKVYEKPPMAMTEPPVPLTSTTTNNSGNTDDDQVGCIVDAVMLDRMATEDDEDTTTHNGEDSSEDLAERFEEVGGSHKGNESAVSSLGEEDALHDGASDDDDDDEFLNSIPPRDADLERLLADGEGQNDEDNDEGLLENKEEEEEEEGVTSTAEKHSLLMLAAEHDRVDILKAILADDTANASSADNETREELLSSRIPPLHIAVSYGSIGAVNCLLRMGADPGIRPNVQALRAAATAKDATNNNYRESRSETLDIPHMDRFDDASAWELAFGTPGHGEEDSVRPKRWSIFGGGSDGEDDKKEEETEADTKSLRIVKPFQLSTSKREGIRHAFTAEALRSIGSDEVDRLRQLLHSGMPQDIDIGGKSLYDWSVEMGALQCEELLRPAEKQKHDAAVAATNVSTPNANNTNGIAATPVKRQSAVLDRRYSSSDPGAEASVLGLVNRLDELEALSQMLSGALDNLAEEVSVCHGLLLSSTGGGASALAAHVRSLKALRERRQEELEREREALENSEDELAYWVRECGTKEAERIAALMTMPAKPKTAMVSPGPPQPPPSKQNGSGPSPEINMNNHQQQKDNQQQRKQLLAQIAASETRVRKLRVAMADLSEESARDLAAVEERGLTGGITLVRNIRDEIRTFEFALSEVKTEDATCRTKISMVQCELQARRNNQQPKSTEVNSEDGRVAVTEGSIQSETLTTPLLLSPANDEPAYDPLSFSSNGDSNFPATTAAGAWKTVAENKMHNGLEPAYHSPQRKSVVSELMTDSHRISAGHSTAIVVRNNNGGGRGLFPASLWQVILRIIGLGRNNYNQAPPPSGGNMDITSAMIV